MTMHRFWSRVKGASARRLARWFGRRSFVVPANRRVITFTFDDFPRFSLLTGGSILEQAGLTATYYTALGLAGKTIATGQMFVADDVPDLLARGHELGCHTHDHCPAWETPTRGYVASVELNLRTFAAAAPTSRLETHSYPISYPRPATKVRLGKLFRACRGGGQVPNFAASDLNYLNSLFLEQCEGNIRPIEEAIGATMERGGWLIFSTHDVAESHTRFGCSPAFFSHVVRCAVQSGATILPMAKALDLLAPGQPAASHRTTSSASTS